MKRRRKITAAEMQAILAQQTVGEIIESDVTEVAGVDRPATGREWRFFKAVGDGPIPQPAGLTNYRTCLENDPMATPTVCEAAGGEPDARGNLVDALAADMSGHDATLADAKMLRDAEQELQGKATFDECVQAVMSEPGFEPQGDKTPEESARAICATKPGGPQEGKMIMRGQKCPVGKDAAMDEMPPPTADDLMPEDAMPDQPETVEIPSKPTELALGALITLAQEMGLPEQVASDVGEAVRLDYGDPTDDQKLLVPDGTTPEGLINAAALKLGVAKSLTTPPTAADRSIKLTGRSYWKQKVRKFLGLEDPRPGVQLAAYLRGLDSRLEGVMAEQVKGRQDNDRRMDQLITLLAGAIGVELPAAGAAPVAPVEPTPAPAGDPTTAAAGNPLFAEGKSAKDGAAAGAPVPAAPTIEERMARFEQVLAQVLAQLQAAPPIEDEDEVMPDMVGAGAGAAAPSAPVPVKRVSVPAPLIKSGMVNRFAGAKAATSGEVVASTLLGGLPINRTEREAAAANGGGLPRFARR